MKRRVIVVLCVTPLLLAAAILLGYNFHILLSGSGAFSYRPRVVFGALLEIENVRLFTLIFAAAELLMLLIAILSTPSAARVKNDTYKVISGICIPVAAGHGEYGTAWFTSQHELRRHFCYRALDAERIRRLTEEANHRDS